MFCLIFILRPAKLLLISVSVYKHKAIYIKSWGGRLGNNLIQLAQAMYLSRKLECNIFVPVHDFLYLDPICSIHNGNVDHNAFAQSIKYLVTYQLFLVDLTYGDVKKTNGIVIDPNLFRVFFYNYDIFPFRMTLSDYRFFLKEVIAESLPTSLDTCILDETLVIHIRSGDTFDKQKYHSAYVQPPLGFYLKIINEQSYRDIVIVTEKDFENPCISHLKKMFPKIRIQASSLEEDVSTLLSARNLVVSLSSFSLVLAFSSQMIKRLYIPKFDIKKGYYRTVFWPSIMRDAFFSSVEKPSLTNILDFELYFYKHIDYTPIGSWKRDQKQLDFLFNYDLNNIIKYTI